MCLLTASDLYDILPSVKIACVCVKGNDYTFKGDNYVPLGAGSFLLEQAPLQKGFGVQESKQEVKTDNSVIQKKNVEKLLGVFVRLKKIKERSKE